MIRLEFCRFWIVMVIAMTMTGCTARQRPSCCPPSTTPLGEPVISTKVEGAGVVSDFSSIESIDAIERNLLSEVGFGETLLIDLQESICLAAAKSKLGDLIDAEKAAVECQSDECANKMVALVLAGQAMELRNEDAGRAGELFMKLVEVRLQRNLLFESQQELDALKIVLDKAATAGFATAKGRNELESRQISLKRKRSELNANEQRLQYELNHLFGYEQATLRAIHPVFELVPEFIPFDAASETLIAETRRPGIQAFETVFQCDPTSDSLYQVLTQMDPRLGIKMPTPKPSILRCSDVPDPTHELRRSQFNAMVESLRRDARIQAAEALLRIQSSHEQLALITEDIERLTRRMQQLEAGMEVFNGETFLKIKQTWAERQAARSELVGQAIEAEVGKLKLLQAQGRLMDECTMDPICCQPTNDQITCDDCRSQEFQR